MRAEHRRSLAFLLVAFALSCAFAALDADAVEGPPTDARVAERHGISVADVARLHAYRKLTNHALMEMPSATVRRVLWKLDNPRPDQPLGAAEFRQLQQSGSVGGSIPAQAVATALSQLEAMREGVTRELQPVPPSAVPPGTTPETSGLPRPSAYRVGGIPVGPLPSRRMLGAPTPEAGSVPDPRRGILQLDIEPLPPLRPRGAPRPEVGGLQRTGWKWLGPGNIGGRTRAIAIHPTDPRIMWLAAVAGGVWKTTDGGLNWGPLADFMASLNISTLILDPHNPDVLYAGTGEGFYNLDAFRGAGVFRSNDGGATWHQMPVTNTQPFVFVNRLAISSDGAALLAVTREGLFRSTNFRMPDIAEVSFSAVDDLRGRDILDVSCSKSTALRQCVAGGRGRTAYFSTDHGASWSMASGLPDPDPAERFRGRVELAIALADPKIVYASVDEQSGAVYRSKDGGRTYELRNGAAQHLSGQGWYNNAIWAGDPTNPDVVVVGGLDLYRSTDGAGTLTQISEWWRAPLSAHADQHAIVASPTYDGVANRSVYFANDGGIYRNDDVLIAAASVGWVSLNNNFGVTQFYGAAGNPFSGRLVGGTQDNGTLLYRAPPGPGTGPNGYIAMFGGDGGFAAADPTNPNFMYGEYVYLQIHRSVNGGERASYIYNGIGDANDPAGALFIAPFILDPENPNRMLAGGRSLWRSENVKAATPSWRAIKAPIDMGAKISAIEARGRDGTSAGSDRLWVGYTNGAVFRSTEGLARLPAWLRVDENGLRRLPNRYVTRIRIDPRNLDRAYVAFAGFEPENVWRSDDNGTTWESLGPLPKATVYDVALHPADSSLLYAATEVGLFASDDGGRTWWPSNEGPANVAVQELFWMGEVLVAATHGRGVFWIDLGDAVSPPTSTPEAGASALPGFTGPSTIVPTDPANSR